ncbi:MAG: hypothetical protein RLZZ546_1876 [Bacteroidota bacterium]
MDEDLYEAIEKWAADEFRSVNGQIEWMLSKSLSTNGRLKEKKSKKNEINTQKE